MGSSAPSPIRKIKETAKKVTQKVADIAEDTVSSVAGDRAGKLAKGLTASTGDLLRGNVGGYKRSAKENLLGTRDLFTEGAGRLTREATEDAFGKGTGKLLGSLASTSASTSTGDVDGAIQGTKESVGNTIGLFAGNKKQDGPVDTPPMMEADLVGEEDDELSPIAETNYTGPEGVEGPLNPGKKRKRGRAALIG